MLQNLYTNYRGRWNQAYEAEYQQLAAKVGRFNSSSRDERNQLLASGGQAAWINLFHSYEHARLARLTSFLRQREPDAEINYSILIYQLSAVDLERAIDGAPIELVESADFSD